MHLQKVSYVVLCLFGGFFYLGWTGCARPGEFPWRKYKHFCCSEDLKQYIHAFYLNLTQVLHGDLNQIGFDHPKVWWVCSGCTLWGGVASPGLSPAHALGFVFPAGGDGHGRAESEPCGRSNDWQLLSGRNFQWRAAPGLHCSPAPPGPQ